jgi:hypothetical protein
MKRHSMRSVIVGLVALLGLLACKKLRNLRLMTLILNHAMSTFGATARVFRVISGIPGA